VTRYQATLTDTFGGDPNYAWVRRETFEAPDDASQALLIRRAKRAVGLTGRGKTIAIGEVIEHRPHSACMVLFVEHQPENDQ